MKLQGETGVIGFHKICYRIIAQRPLSYFKKHFSWILNEKDETKPTLNEIFTPGSYESLSTLVRHTQVCFMTIFGCISKNYNIEDFLYYTTLMIIFRG